jgi:putative transposase
MPRFRRLVVAGYPHHVTQRGVRRQTTFFDDLDYQTYLALALKAKEQFRVELWAYCLMPNHIHAIAVPREDGELSRFFATLHRRYARATNARYDWRGHLWQERFYSVVMDEPHTLSAMRYVELNPVRAGLAATAQDWRWSSARGNLSLISDPLIDKKDTRHPLVSDWREFLSEPVVERELEQLRRRTRVGRPSGDSDFIDRIEAKSGRSVRKRLRKKPKR